MNSVVIRKNYPKTLEGGFSTLTFFYEQLANSCSDADFFRIISENVVPLIRESSQIKPLYEKWIEENEIYEKKLRVAQSKATKNLEETYHSIHVKLRQKKLLDESEISPRIAFIESLIQLESSFKNFRYFQDFSNQLKLLFHQILNLGEISIIQPFAKIENASKAPFLRAVGYADEWQILSYGFGPLLEELSHLEKISNGSLLTKPWVAFNKLLRAERAWNNQRKDLANNRLIKDYLEWKDMESLKDPTSAEKPLYFNHKTYLNHVETLLSEILIHQEKPIVASRKPKTLQDITVPQFIYLDCKCNQLLINVIGMDNEYSEKILIHKFNETSSPRDFFEDLMQQDIGTVVDCETGGGTVSKHILEVKLPKIFSDLFIHRISKHKAALKTNPIAVKDISTTEADKLFKEINRLKTKNEKVSKKKSKQTRASK